jgi:Gram-negative bacterial TonB protein C-terminal
MRKPALMTSAQLFVARLSFFALLATSVVSPAADKPTIYNQVSDGSAEMDTLVNAALAPKFTIVDIPASTDYVPPKPLVGHVPRTARTQTGALLGGHVLIAYVVTAEGRAAEPVILKTADPQLSRIALAALADWRFAPATLKGTPISTTAAQEFIFETPPPEFVTQVLEPTGGKIQRPKDWFYTENHHETAYVWTLSREDPSGNRPYTTGVRIQTFVGVKAATGKTAQQFILDFLAAKKKEPIKVLRNCEEHEQGLFTETCLETEEGDDHILYSLFWGRNGLDIAIVTVSGTPKDLWEIYAPAFAKMSAFELIDPKRFQK